jgi:hypothetical protein
VANIWSDAVRVYIGGYDPGTTTTSASITLSAPPVDKTFFGDSAEGVHPGIRVDEIEWAGVFADGVGGINDLIGTILGSAGEVVQLQLGTATGDRAYVGTAFTLSGKPGGELRGLVRVEAAWKPEQAFDVARHYGPRKRSTTTAGVNSGAINHGSTSTGTAVYYVQCFLYSATGTRGLTLQDSADGASFVSRLAATFTGVGSQRLEWTGSLGTHTRISQTSPGGTSSGTFDWAAALTRSKA